VADTALVSLSLIALVAWLSLLPLGFWAALLLMPQYLHRRAIRRVSGDAPGVVDLSAVRAQRASRASAAASRAI
jgi:hypothetical protein